MAENDNGDSKKSFQVVDKRRFDATGHERTESMTEQRGSTEATKTQEAGGNFRMEESKSVESEVNFSSFVMSLATQAMVQLGQMAPPPGMDIPVDVESGKGTIDILGMIQQKTLGNLTKEEGKFLEDVLHTLRVAYVKKVKGA
jgi:transcription initiation factor IIF auxiliary subunit